MTAAATVRVLLAQWDNFRQKGLDTAVLATAVPKAVVEEFLEVAEAPGDVFTIIKHDQGLVQDIVVYWDPLLPHEVAGNITRFVTDAVNRMHGASLLASRLACCLSFPSGGICYTSCALTSCMPSSSDCCTLRSAESAPLH